MRYLTLQSEKAVLSVFCDITERKRVAALETEMLASIHLRARQQAAVAYLGQQTIAETDLKEEGRRKREEGRRKKEY